MIGIKLMIARNRNTLRDLQIKATSDMQKDAIASADDLFNMAESFPFPVTEEFFEERRNSRMLVAYAALVAAQAVSDLEEAAGKAGVGRRLAQSLRPDMMIGPMVIMWAWGYQTALEANK